MNALSIKATDDTPSINFDPATGMLEISGRSLPEDAAGFYKPVLDWLKQYGASAKTASSLAMKLEYFNTASSKIILDIFNVVEKFSSDKKVIWYFDKDDEDMQEAGEEFSEIVNIPFEYKTY
ncbi:MAG TPA: DUF1987 domain-containing protein [Cytophagaceae bacterium]|jgi:hypothetical protein|nr:DUF1987 domain-containing protein [Cytophagaceae bacterium]